MGHRVLRSHIWGYSVCLGPIKRTPGLNEITVKRINSQRLTFTSDEKHFATSFMKIVVDLTFLKRPSYKIYIDKAFSKSINRYFELFLDEESFHQNMKYIIMSIVSLLYYL